MKAKNLVLKINVSVAEEDYGKCFDYLRNLKANALADIPLKYKAECEIYLD